MADANLDEIQLNISGDELIYEVEGDAERSNPLDIVTVAEGYSSETVDGVKFDGKKVAHRMMVAWNCHATLVATLNAIVTPGSGAAMHAEVWDMVQAALAKVTKELEWK